MVNPHLMDTNGACAAGGIDTSCFKRTTASSCVPASSVCTGGHSWGCKPRLGCQMGVKTVDSEALLTLPNYFSRPWIEISRRRRSAVGMVGHSIHIILVIGICSEISRRRLMLMVFQGSHCPVFRVPEFLARLPCSVGRN